MELNEFLATVLKKTLEISYKEDQISALKKEIDDIKQELSVLGMNDDLVKKSDGKLYLDKDSGKLFLVESYASNGKYYPLSFTAIKPINFSVCHIVDEIDI